MIDMNGMKSSKRIYGANENINPIEMSENKKLAQKLSAALWIYKPD